jgi:hypothetical protein
LHPTGNCPDEPNHLARDGGGDHDLGRAAGGEMPVSAAQAQLRLPGMARTSLGCSTLQAWSRRLSLAVKR